MPSIETLMFYIVIGFAMLVAYKLIAWVIATVIAVILTAFKLRQESKAEEEKPWQPPTPPKAN